MIEARDLGAIDFGAEPLPGLHAVLARARETAPVVRVRFFGDPAWLITRHADVAAAFADEETMPAAAAYSLFAEPVQGRTLQCMTGEEHRVNRALVSPAFRPSAVRGLVEPLLRPLARDLAAELSEPTGGDGADLVGDFAARYPFLVITRLLGLEGGAVPRLREWATALFSYTTDPEAATAGAARFTGFLRRLIDERRAGPRDDLLSLLATTEVTGPDGGARRLSDEEIFSFIRLLFPAGADTTYRGLGSLLFALLSHSEWWERAREDPASRPAMVEEALRWEPPVAVQPRRSVAARSWDGVEVGPGEWTLFATAGANRDPAVFTDPGAFRPDRAQGKAPVLTFGAGPHYCLGAHLARAELGAALDVLTETFPRLSLAVPPSEVRVTGAILRGPKALPVSLGA